MTDPASELQAALLRALRADDGVIAAFGSRRVHVQDIPPANQQMPYVLVQSASVVPDLADCMDLAETEVTITVWARSDPPSVAAVMDLGRAVGLAAIRLTETASFQVQDARPVRSQYLMAQDGQTGQGSVVIAYATDTV